MTDTMSKDTGGYAFPGLNAEFAGISSDGQERYEIAPSGGMTLRDYFAAHVDVSIYTPLQNLRVKLGRDPTIEELASYVVQVRIIEADAMLAARGQS